MQAHRKVPKAADEPSVFEVWRGKAAESRLFLCVTRGFSESYREKQIQILEAPGVAGPRGAGENLSFPSFAPGA